MHDDEQRVMMPPTKINYNPIDHGFFHELVRLVVCLSTAGLAFDLHKNGHVTPYGAKQPLVVEGKPDISGLELHFFPSLLYQ